MFTFYCFYPTGYPKKIGKKYNIKEKLSIFDIKRSKSHFFQIKGLNCIVNIDDECFFVWKNK